MNRKALVALPILITAVLLTAFFAVMDTPDPVAAQTPVVYHVWSVGDSCTDLLSPSGVPDAAGYMGTIVAGQWYTWSQTKLLPENQNNKIDQYFTVCAFGIPETPPLFQWGMYNYGEGGYRVANLFGVVRLDGSSSTTVYNAEDLEAPGSGCWSLAGGITSTHAFSPTATRWGYRLRNYVSVSQNFCADPTYTEAVTVFRFGEDEPEVLTCENGLGIEVLQAGAVTMPADSAWEGTLITGTLPWERAWVTYWFTSSSTPGRIAGEFNGKTLTLLGWDRYNPDTMNLSVPNRDRPYHRDPYDGHLTYEQFGFVTVPPVNLRFATTQDLILTSVCLKEAARPLTPSLLCPDGLEALTEPLMAGDYAGQVFEDMVAVTATHIAVRYVMENPYYPVERLGGGIRIAPEINGRSFLVTGSWRGRSAVTYTLPTTGAIYLPSQSVKIGFRNEGPQVHLLSICIVDALDTLPQLREAECHLINPDFVMGLGGWSHDGASWMDSGNGGAALEGGAGVWQVPIQDSGTVWKMSVRARAVGAESGGIRFGTSTENLVSGGPQLFTATLPTDWGVYAADVFVEERSPRLTGGIVQVQGENAQIDYVCLTTPDDAMPVPECIRPVWNPAGSGDPLYIYLFKYLADWIMYGICLVIRAISIAYNGLIRLLDNILLRIPNYDPSDGLLGIGEWLNTIIFRMLDWIGASFAEFFQWLGGVFTGMGEFIGDIVTGFVAFLGDLLGFDPFALLDDTNALWNETLAFWDEIQTEIGLEFADLLSLMQSMGNVMIVLVNGVREGVTGETVAYIGTDFEGIGAYIWEGVNFLNTAVENTPLTALNIVALAVMAVTLAQWTLKKFGETVEFLGR